MTPVRDLLGHDISRRQDWQGPAEALLSLQGKPATEIWTCEEWTKLCRHLHNGNGPTGFIMGFNKDGEKVYVRSQKLLVPRAISWSWSTICRRSKSGLTFVPYSTNKDRLSRWGGMDFDAHDGQHQRAREFAFAAFRRLLNGDLFVILESSGLGWHVWAISKEFHPVNQWVRLLKDVAQSIQAPIQSGVCEIFPPDTCSTGCGKGMRAPGSWNPSTDTLNEIYWENTQELLPFLGPHGPEPVHAQLTDIERNSSFSSPSFSDGSGTAAQYLYREWERNWSGQFSITSAATRNNQLAGLVGEMFHQVGYGMAQRIVEAQFTTKTVKTRKTLEGHVESFGLLWRGLHRDWVATLSPTESTLFQGLKTDAERDAFRIIRSYHRFSVSGKQPDFPIAAENLGERLGITMQGVCEMRKKFVSAGIIVLTQRYQPNKTAARYKWLPAADAIASDEANQKGPA